MKLRLNVAFLRKKVPNLTVAAKEIGLRPATVSNLCTGKIPLEKAEVQTLAKLASLAGCLMDDLVLSDDKLRLVETGIKAIDFLLL
ncbi:ATP synthase beta chain [Bacillus sp. JCM 19047]|nr:ATP synthase beta chain [Bacillus sp. JCM 19047]